MFHQLADQLKWADNFPSKEVISGALGYAAKIGQQSLVRKSTYNDMGKPQDYVDFTPSLYMNQGLLLHAM